MTHNSSTHSSCPEPNPEWPAVFPKASQTAALYLCIAWLVYLTISLAALYKRRHYQPLRSRRLGLVSATVVLGGCFGFVAVALREYIGRDIFPCTIYLYATVLLPPATICPFVARLLHHRSRVEWQLKFISMPLGQRTDVQEADMLAAKYRASARRAYLAFFLIFVAFVLIALVYQKTQERYSVKGCVGCEMTFGDAMLVASLFLVLAIMIMVGIRRLNKKSDGSQTQKSAKHPEVYDIEKALLVFAFWTILWTVMRTVDPGNLSQDGVFASGYWLVFAMINASIQLIWIPVYQSFHKTQGSGKNVTLQEVLAHPTLSQAFESFLMREFAAENYRFLFEVRRWVRSKPSEESGKDTVAWKDVANDIYKTFAANDSILQVNLAAATKQHLDAIFNSSAAPDVAELVGNKMDLEAPLSEEVFAESVREIEQMLELDSYPRFMTSAEFMEATSKTPASGSSTITNSMRPGMKSKMSSSNFSSYSGIKPDGTKGFVRNKIVLVDEENEGALSSSSSSPRFGIEE